MALAVYLNDVQQELTEKQKEEIMKILQSSKSHIIQNTDHDEKGVNDKYIFDVNDNWLFWLSIFETTTAQKIKQLVDHKLTLLLLLIFGWIPIFVVGTDAYFGDNNHWVNYFLIAVYVLWIAWFILKHLLFNRTAFTLCVKSFDYWIKVGYMVIASVSGSICNTRLTAVSLWDIRIIILCIQGLLCISYLSAFDAVNTSKRMKWIASVVASLIYLIFTVLYQFFSDDADDYKITIKLPHGESIISMQALAASSCRILCIFCIKQSYQSFKSKDRAIAISYSPKITWINSATCAQSTETKNESSERAQTTVNYVSNPQELQLSNALKLKKQTTESLSYHIESQQNKQCKEGFDVNSNDNNSAVDVDDTIDDEGIDELLQIVFDDDAINVMDVNNIHL